MDGVEGAISEIAVQSLRINSTDTNLESGLKGYDVSLSEVPYFL